MKAAGFESQSALARASGVPQPTINRILNGVGKKGPEAHTLVQLASACNVTFEWLHEGIGQRERGAAAAAPASFSQVVVAPEDDTRFYQIQKVRLRLSAGISGFAVEPETYDGSTVSVPRHWADRNGYIPERLIGVKVRGESMEPSLYEDDLVIINTADNKPVDGAVFAVNYEGEPVVKRMSRDAGQWWLTSDNPDQRKYHRKVCRGNDCIIIGRVVRKESDRI
ncbi:Phage repressor protein C, contains Cro/C1-type HTH and peptisase s24 domains [Pseudoduganella namucuonensis]|uniref:Phage repressor protein C, contains Cro/C1-type HTH and peptisase s24 domains n=2 Tax=Pseudoduganella namucuonensis TaxID=1035707 RepID=A0A1I7J333_9BURK|nr:Phage repressor protein C, contains Cro/C1-type HTH and peptisase s24 domains [Pseudoduganella namucuonensis]